MNREHLANLDEAQLYSAIKPILVHDSWPYFEEFLRREQSKQITLTMRALDHPSMNRGQGAYQELEKLLTLRTSLLSAS